MRRSACIAASIVAASGRSALTLAPRHRCCFHTTKSQSNGGSLSLSLLPRWFATRAPSNSLTTEEDTDYATEEDTGYEDLDEDFSSDDLIDEGASYDDYDDVDEDGSETIEGGDGEDGGGIVLGGTAWGSKALEILLQMLPSGGPLSLYGFKVCSTGFIHIRLDKLTDRFGSPTIQEVEDFNTSYRTLLEEAARDGLVPSDLSIEVSSPGAERIVQIPGELDRFKELPMQVHYYQENTEKQGVFQLDSWDEESLMSVWRLANVRVNREALGKGRRLNKKQRDWKLELPFAYIKMVRLYVDGVD